MNAKTKECWCTFPADLTLYFILCKKMKNAYSNTCTCLNTPETHQTSFVLLYVHYVWMLQHRSILTQRYLCLLVFIILFPLINCIMFFSAEDSDVGLGVCGWLLTAFSWMIVIVTLPFSLCVCFKVGYDNYCDASCLINSYIFKTNNLPLQMHH